MTKQDNKQFNEFHSKLDAISDSVNSIVFAIESDVKQKRVGIAEQTTINTKDIAEIKVEKKIIIGKVGLITSFISLILGLAGGFVVKYFFK